MNSRRVTVQIVAAVHNRRGITLQCLRSISRFADERVEAGVVIVDDGSTDGTSDAIRRHFPQVDVVGGSGELWYTEGTNVGIRRALEKRPDYVLIINDDQVFDVSCLSYLVETAEANPNSVVGPLLLLWNSPHQLFQVSPRWQTMAGGWRHWYSQTVWTVPASPWEVELIVGNCVLVPAVAFEAHGLMDSNRYPNFGDAEFTPRLRRVGYQLLIDPRARVFCQPNSTPVRVRAKTIKGLITDLIVDLRSVQNLRRRFYASVDGAPTRLRGIVAFLVFLGRAVIGNSAETRIWGDAPEEPPLSKTYESKIIDGG
ncbi:MAG: glycosyltransferase family 2 protein [Pyrinomonadaceae bacterium]